MAYSQSDLNTMMRIASSMNEWDPNYDILWDNIAQAIIDVSQAGHVSGSVNTTTGNFVIVVDLGDTVGGITSTHHQPPPTPDPTPPPPPPDLPPPLIRYYQVRQPRVMMPHLTASEHNDSKWKANSDGTNWYRRFWKSRPTINYLDPVYVSEDTPSDPTTPWATIWAVDGESYTLEYNYGVPAYYTDSEGGSGSSWSMPDAKLTVVDLNCDSIETIRLSFSQYSSSTPDPAAPPFKGMAKNNPRVGYPGELYAPGRNTEGHYSSIGQIIGGIGVLGRPFEEAYCDAVDHTLWNMDMPVRWLNKNETTLDYGPIGSIGYGGQPVRIQPVLGRIEHGFGSQGASLNDCFSAPVIGSPYSYVDSEYAYIAVTDGTKDEWERLKVTAYRAFKLTDPELWKTPVWPTKMALHLVIHAWPTPMVFKSLNLIEHQSGY